MSSYNIELICYYIFFRYCQIWLNILNVQLSGFLPLLCMKIFLCLCFVFWFMNCCHLEIFKPILVLDFRFIQQDLEDIWSSFDHSNHEPVNCSCLGYVLVCWINWVCMCSWVGFYLYFAWKSSFDYVLFSGSWISVTLKFSSTSLSLILDLFNKIWKTYGPLLITQTMNQSTALV